ncbi:hypothetical protein BRC89_11865 [Halobacteriales archaeon QS_4_70_19]|nr:MAG: hypothetical protein BRC89_11865 [Halobacteriales archaeon QS_4_70_19]
MDSKQGTSVLGTVTRWIRRLKPGGEGTAERTEQGSPLESLEYDPEGIERRADIYTELGLRPAQFVRRIVEQRGGMVPQQDLCQYWSFSQSTGCRLLQDLEEEGVIKRYRIGQGKIVTLAEEPALTTEAADTPTAADPADGSTDARRGR